MYEPDQQRLIMGVILLRVICEANGGREPETIWQYRRAAKRFGVRIRVLSGIGQSQLRQGERSGEQGVIFVRRTRNMGHLRREILHELGEAASRWEGWPPCVTCVSRHEAATFAVMMAA